MRPTPSSPVHRHRKFSAVRETMSTRSSISMRPLGDLPIVISRNTTGLSVLVIILWYVVCGDVV